MKVKVKFIGAVRQAIGEEQRSVNIETGTVRELLEQIYKIHPRAKGNLKMVGIFIEGRLVKDSELQEPILRDGQEVSMILPVAGG